MRSEPHNHGVQPSPPLYDLVGVALVKRKNIDDGGVVGSGSHSVDEVGCILHASLTQACPEDFKGAE